MQLVEGYVPTDKGVRIYFQRIGNGPNPVIVPNALFMFEDFKRMATGRTMVFIDWRSRGRSDYGGNDKALVKGVQHDIDDLEAVRLHFEFDRVALIGHSYSAVTAVLYALRNPAHVDRVIQIGPMQPFPDKDYPTDLKNWDEIYHRTLAAIQQLARERESLEPTEFCRKFYALVRDLYVVNSADIVKLQWDPCQYANERTLWKAWVEYILPSVSNIRGIQDDLARLPTPVLTIHGRKDRSAPYGGGMEWASMMPNARLLALEDCGHFPWVERPQSTFEAIELFLAGAWPEGAHRIR